MRMPAAGSRSVITSQKLIFVVTPTPSGVGQIISGASFFSTGGGGAAGFRAGRRVWAVAAIAQKNRKSVATARLKGSRSIACSYCVDDDEDFKCASKNSSTRCHA